MFRGGLTIAVLFGIPVRVHWTFLLLLGWVIWRDASGSGSLTTGFASAGLTVAVFVCVVAHEFGHILVARAFGVRTRDVTILPIGGVATLERIPENPVQELAIAVAGPAVNVVIVVILLAVTAGRVSYDPWSGLTQPMGFGVEFLLSLATINILLVLFNSIPAFPMDGGRVLRAVLAMVMDHTKATGVAAIVGQVLAIGMAAWALVGSMPLLLILAWFIFMAARAEGRNAKLRALVRGLPVAAATVCDVGLLRPDDSVHAVMAGTRQAAFLVTQTGDRSGAIVGGLSRADMSGALQRLGQAATVRQVMRPLGPPVAESASLATALDLLRQGRYSVFAVVRDGALVGVLTAESVLDTLGARRRSNSRS